MKTIFAIIYFFILSTSVECQILDTLEFDCDKLNESVKKFYSYYLSKPLPNNQWMSINNSTKNDTLKLTILFGKESDTTHLVQMDILDQKIVTLVQYYNGKQSGLTIENSIIYSENPYLWETFYGFDYEITMAYDGGFIIFYSSILTENEKYIISCVSDEELHDRFFEKEK